MFEEKFYYLSWRLFWNNIFDRKIPSLKFFLKVMFEKKILLQKSVSKNHVQEKNSTSSELVSTN